MATTVIGVIVGVAAFTGGWGFGKRYLRQQHAPRLAAGLTVTRADLGLLGTVTGAAVTVAGVLLGIGVPAATWSGLVAAYGLLLTIWSFGKARGSW